MGSLLHVLAALFLVALAEGVLPPSPPRPWAVLLALALPHALFLATARAGRAGRFRLAQLLALALEVAAPLGFAACVLAFGWLATVRERLGLEPGLLAWPGPGLVATLAPWALLELLAIDARARLATAPGARRRQAIAFERRMLASGAAPFLLYVLGAALVGASDRLRVPLEEIGLLSALFTVLSLGLFLLLLPAVLRRTWRTSALPAGGRRAMLEALARRAGFRYGSLLVWHTGHRMANAAIVGVTPGQRAVLLSDALLEELSPRELAAVFAHEMGHALRHHAAFFVMTLGLVFVALQLAVRTVAPRDEALQLGLLALLFAGWALCFGYLSRRFELEADLESLEVVGEAAPLVAALYRVGGAHAHERDSWRHFSTARRAAFLQAAERDPRIGARLRARLRRVRRGTLVLFAAAALAEGAFLVRDVPRERTLAALRLGAWEAASRALPAGAGEGLAELVRRSAELAPGAGWEPIEEAARAALARDEIEAAGELLELARLRGSPHAGRVLDALGGSAADSGALPEAWHATLEALAPAEAAPDAPAEDARESG